MKSKIFVAAAIAALTGCNREFDRPDVSGIELEVCIKPFYKDFFKEDATVAEKVERLHGEYGQYFTDYCKEMHLGPEGSIVFEQNLSDFLNYSKKENAEVIAAADSLLERTKGRVEDELKNAFKCLKYFIPGISVPQVYCHISGFNSKLLVDSAFVSFSIEHYLGKNCRFYEWLDVPVYARRTKDVDFIAPDILRAWLYGNYPLESEADDVLNNMVYQGKILYVMWRCMPHMTKAEVLGFSEQQLEWCIKNEKNMWGFMAEQQLLYSTKPMDKSKLCNEAPFTSFFGQASPGRSALYCGLNIVMRYMERKPNTTLEELLQMHDAQQLMVGAAYNPK